MKKYLTNERQFLREYKVINDKIELFLGDDSTTQIDNSTENIDYLDNLMLEQHYDYPNNITFFNSKENLNNALLIGGGAFLLGALDQLSHSSILSSLEISTILALGGTSVSYYLLGSSKAKEASADYIKDELFLQNQKSLEMFITSKAFCKSFSDKLQQKLLKLSNIKKDISLNDINDFTINDIKTLVLKMNDFNEKSEVFIKKYNKNNTRKKKARFR